MNSLFSRLIIFILAVMLIIVLHTCAFTGKSVPITDIRIEDAQVSTLFSQNPNVESYIAQWSGSRVDLISDSDKSAMILTSFSLEDDYEFRSTGSASRPLYARVVSGRNNSALTWSDVNTDNPESQKLIFVIEPEQPDAEYKNMVYVPGGYIMMGSKYQKDELPIHRVYVDGFYIDKYEVSVAEYREFCRATRRIMPKQPYWNDDTHPVVKVKWNDAAAYAKWKNKRLPTEAEWEYAARSGRKGYFYAWGNHHPERRKGGNIADEALRSEKKFWRVWKNYYDGFVYTAPRGSFLDNDFGIYDMTGNVWEWCSDWYDANYYKVSPESNPQGPDKGSHKVLRGGAWNFSPRDILTTRRMHYRSDVELDYIGFRCVKSK